MPNQGFELGFELRFELGIELGIELEIELGIIMEKTKKDFITISYITFKIDMIF